MRECTGFLGWDCKGVCQLSVLSPFALIFCQSGVFDTVEFVYNDADIIELYYSGGFIEEGTSALDNSTAETLKWLARIVCRQSHIICKLLYLAKSPRMKIYLYFDGNVMKVAACVEHCEEGVWYAYFSYIHENEIFVQNSGISTAIITSYSNSYSNKNTQKMTQYTKEDSKYLMASLLLSLGQIIMYAPRPKNRMSVLLIPEQKCPNISWWNNCQKKYQLRYAW